MQRCAWCAGDPVMEQYHDEEWGVPVYTDHEIFERMALEMFQAGLSWRTILYKRDAFRSAFFDFDIDKVAVMNEQDVDCLMQEKEIVRHRKKIESTVANAQECLRLREKHGSLWDYLQTLHTMSIQEIQIEFRNKFRFMGPVVTESFLQCMGIAGSVHETSCWKYDQEVDQW